MLKSDTEWLFEIIFPRIFLAELFGRQVSIGIILHVNDGKPTVGKSMTNMTCNQFKSVKKSKTFCTLANDIVSRLFRVAALNVVFAPIGVC